MSRPPWLLNIQFDFNRAFWVTADQQCLQSYVLEIHRAWRQEHWNIQDPCQHTPMTVLSKFTGKCFNLIIPPFLTYVTSSPYSCSNHWNSKHSDKVWWPLEEMDWAWLDSTHTMWARLSGFSGKSGNMGCRGSRVEAQLRDLLRALENFLAGDFCKGTQNSAHYNIE